MKTKVRAVQRFVSSAMPVRWFPQIWSNYGSEGTSHPCFVDLRPAYVAARFPDGFKMPQEAERAAREFLGEAGE